MKRDSRLSLHIGNSKKKLFALIVVSLLVLVPLLSARLYSSSSAASTSSLAIDRTNFYKVSDNDTISLKLSTFSSPDLIIALVAVGTNTSVTAHIADTNQ